MRGVSAQIMVLTQTRMFQLATVVRKLFGNGWRLRLISVSLTFCLFLTGCQSFSLSQEEESLRKEESSLTVSSNPATLHLAVPSLPEKVDPFVLYQPWERALCAQVYEGLTAASAHGRASLRALERAEGEDGIHWTLVLREGLHWSDGSPLTAQDYRDTWLRRLQAGREDAMRMQNVEKNALVSASQEARSKFAIFAGGREFLEGTGKLPVSSIQAKGNSLYLTLSEPFPRLLDWLSDPVFYPEKQDESGNPLYNGAFVPQKQDDSHWVLVPNQAYWDRFALFWKRVEIQAIPDGIQAYEAFRNGILDLFGDPFYPVPRERREEVASFPRRLTLPSSRIGYVRVRTEQPLFSSPQRMQALYSLLDPDFLQSGLLFDGSPSWPPRSRAEQSEREAAATVLKDGYSQMDWIRLRDTPLRGWSGPDPLNHRILALVAKEWMGAMPVAISLSLQAPKTQASDFTYAVTSLPSGVPEDWILLLRCQGFLPQGKTIELKDLPLQGIFPLHLRQTTLLLQEGLEGLDAGFDGLLSLQTVVRKNRPGN